MKTGEKIKKIHQLRGLTQVQLADLVGLPVGRMKQYEINVRNPKKVLLEKFAEVLEVPVVKLKGNEFDNKEEAREVLNDMVIKFGKDFVIKALDEME